MNFPPVRSRDVASPSSSTPSVRRSALVASLAAAVVVAALALFVGIDRLAAAFATVPPSTLALLAGLAGAWLLAWGTTLYVVLRALGRAVPLRRAVLLYASVNFANSVAPFAHLGAEPLAALFLSRGADVEYETSLAAVAGVDALNLLPSSGFVLVGVCYFALTTTLDAGVGLAAAIGVVLVAAVPVAGYLAYRRRRSIAARIGSAAVAVATPICRLLPGVAPPTEAGIRAGVEGVVAGLARLSGDRRRVAAGLALSAVGWALLATSLWVAVAAVARPLPVSVPLFVVPLSLLAVVIPLPGGAGGVEAAIALLLVALAGLSPVDAAAGAFLHRGATWALPVLVGGAVTALTGIGRGRTSG